MRIPLTELEAEILRFVANVKIVHREPLQHALKYLLKAERRARTDGQRIRHIADDLVRNGLLAKQRGAHYYLPAKGRAWLKTQLGLEVGKPGLNLFEHDRAVAEVVAKLRCAVAESAGVVEWYEQHFKSALPFPYSAEALAAIPAAATIARVNPDYFFLWRFPHDPVPKTYYALELYRDVFDRPEIEKRLARYDALAPSLEEAGWAPLMVLVVAPPGKVSGLVAWAGKIACPSLFRFTSLDDLVYTQAQKNFFWLGEKGLASLLPKESTKIIQSR